MPQETGKDQNKPKAKRKKEIIKRRNQWNWNKKIIEEINLENSFFKKQRS